MNTSEPQEVQNWGHVDDIRLSKQSCDGLIIRGENGALIGSVESGTPVYEASIDGGLKSFIIGPAPQNRLYEVVSRNNKEKKRISYGGYSKRNAEKMYRMKKVHELCDAIHKKLNFRLTAFLKNALGDSLFDEITDEQGNGMDLYIEAPYYFSEPQTRFLSPIGYRVEAGFIVSDPVEQYPLHDRYSHIARPTQKVVYRMLKLVASSLGVERSAYKDDSQREVKGGDVHELLESEIRQSLLDRKVKDTTHWNLFAPGGVFHELIQRTPSGEHSMHVSCIAQNPEFGRELLDFGFSVEQILEINYYCMWFDGTLVQEFMKRTDSVETIIALSQRKISYNDWQHLFALEATAGESLDPEEMIQPEMNDRFDSDWLSLRYMRLVLDLQTSAWEWKIRDSIPFLQRLEGVGIRDHETQKRLLEAHARSCISPQLLREIPSDWLREFDGVRHIEKILEQDPDRNELLNMIDLWRYLVKRSNAVNKGASPTQSRRISAQDMTRILDCIFETKLEPGEMESWPDYVFLIPEGDGSVVEQVVDFVSRRDEVVDEIGIIASLERMELDDLAIDGNIVRLIDQNGKLANLVYCGGNADETAHEELPSATRCGAVIRILIEHVDALGHLYQSNDVIFHMDEAELLQALKVYDTGEEEDITVLEVLDLDENEAVDSPSGWNHLLWTWGSWTPPVETARDTEIVWQVADTSEIPPRERKLYSPGAYTGDGEAIVWGDESQVVDHFSQGYATGLEVGDGIEITLDNFRTAFLPGFIQSHTDITVDPARFTGDQVSTLWEVFHRCSDGDYSALGASLLELQSEILESGSLTFDVNLGENNRLDIDRFAPQMEVAFSVLREEQDISIEWLEATFGARYKLNPQAVVIGLFIGYSVQYINNVHEKEFKPGGKIDVWMGAEMPREFDMACKKREAVES